VERSGLLRINLRVEVRDRRGKLVGVREKESDLILDNFRDVLAVLLTPREDLSLGLTRKASLVNTGGTAYNIPVWANAENAPGQGLSFTGAHRDPYWTIGAYIQIGTSTVAPTRGDYKLGAFTAWGVPTQTVGADYISWAVSIVLEAAADIAEAGLVCLFQSAHLATTAWPLFLLFRDTFTPISVPAGGTISVTYTLSL